MMKAEIEMKKDDEIFKRNPDYDNGFGVFFEQQYKTAMKNGDMALIKELNEQLFEHLFGFVMYNLHKYSPSLLSNPKYRDDLIQDTWLTIYENAGKYQSGKGSFTTYFEVWFKNIKEKFYNRYIYHTSSYYSKNIKRIESAVNECRQKNIEPDMETLSQMTGLSERQITNANLQKAHSECVSFSEEWEASVLHSICGKRRPAAVL